MVTVEVRINDRPIGHLTIWNLLNTTTTDATAYRFSYEQQERNDRITGEVMHVRSEPVEKLVANVLADIVRRG